MAEEEKALNKDLVAFCNRITPVNWHVTSDPHGLAFQGPGTLNILVRLTDYFVGGWFYAFKKGSMNFHSISDYEDGYEEARKSINRYGDYLVGESEILIYPDGCAFFGDNLYTTAVHELAHVAVDRWLAFKQKSFRSPSAVDRSKRGEPHDEVFCRAFERLIQRVDRLSENSRVLIQSMKSELDTYRFSGAKSSPLNEVAPFLLV
jgi:hypothetical protein